MYCSLILLVYVFWMSHTSTLCVLTLGDECVSLSIYALLRQWNIFRNFHSKVFSCLIISSSFVIFKTQSLKVSVAGTEGDREFRFTTGCYVLFQPIPYWLYKLHGLNIVYKCEICGNYEYKGPKTFQRHFAVSMIV